MKRKIAAIATALCLIGTAAALTACKEPEEPELPEREVVSIEVDVSGGKTEYVAQETLDTAGIIVTVTYSDGTEETVSPDDCTFTGFDSSIPTIGDLQVITVTYEGKTDTYEITIEAPDAEVPEDGLFNVEIPGFGVFTFNDAENWEITFTGVFAAMAPGGPFTGTCSYEDGKLAIVSSNTNITIDKVVVNADGSAVIEGTNVMLAQYGESFGIDGKFSVDLSADQVKQLTGGETPSPTL